MNESSPAAGQAVFGIARLVGRLGDDRLVECSGIDTSLATGNHIWAINDGGKRWPQHGVCVDRWRKKPRLGRDGYLFMEGPSLEGERYRESSTVNVAWHIVFSYPDRKHDAEGVAVDTDTAAGKILILTKRDDPPLLFELPLILSDHPIVAKKVAAVRQIPPPSDEDLMQKHGKHLSRPTTLDLSPDGHQAVVLTYRQAYLFNRRSQDSWAATLSRHPKIIPLPRPRDRNGFRQREATCFAPGGKALLVTSEGRGAEMFRVEPKLSGF